MNDINIEYQTKTDTDRQSEALRLGTMIKALRLSKGLKRKEFADSLNIPLGTVRDWEQGKRKMPDYVYELIEYRVTTDEKYQTK